MFKRVLLIIFLIAFLSSPSIAFDEWSNEDIQYQIILTVFTSIDWIQTIQIAKDSDRYFEMNPVLGRNPSIGEVNRFMITNIIGHAIITHLLPKECRRPWQAFWLGVEFNNIRNNYMTGIKIEF